jgi:hypothetical protein
MFAILCYSSHKPLGPTADLWISQQVVIGGMSQLAGLLIFQGAPKNRSGPDKARDSIVLSSA